MDLMTLVAYLTLDTSQYEKGISSLGGKLKSLGIAAGLAALTKSAVNFGKAAVNAGMNFDASMSKVAAISGATGKSLDALRDKAQEMGAKTKFSASESADAFTYMAMAGWKTEEMLDGIEGVMNLAAASGESLATTSDIVTDALTAFGMEAKDAGHFSDILAAASSNANTNVSMMGETIKYAAPIAGALGFSAEDTALAIGLMANSGIKASQAGTSLRMIMNQMTGPIDITGKKLGKVTIQTTKADGSMRDLSDILADCRDAFSQLSESEKAAAAENIAGKNAMSGFLAIMNATDKDVNKLSNAIKNCNGESERMAATMQDNLAGDVTIFKSALEGLYIVISDVITPTLREFVQYGTSALQDLTEAFRDGGLEGGLEKLADILADGIDKFITNVLPKLSKFVARMVRAIAKSIIDNRHEIINAALEVMQAVISTLAEESPGLLAAILGVVGIKVAKTGSDIATMISLAGAGSAASRAASSAASAAAAGGGAAAAGGGAAAAGGAAAGIGAISTAAVAATGAVVALGTTYVIFDKKFKQLSQQEQVEASKAVDTYTSLYETKGKEIADQWAQMAYGIQTEGMSVAEAQYALVNKVTGLWSETPKNAWEALQAEWNKYFGAGGSGISGLFNDAIVKPAKSLVSNASFWGSDLIVNFTNGISSMWERAKGVVSNFASMIRSYLGFSEPEEGPLSDFHTYAPDMMKLFAQGIEDNRSLITDAIGNTFNIAPTITEQTGVEEIVTPRGGTSRNIIIPVYIDGREFARAEVPYIEAEQNRVGVRLAGVM